MNIVFDDIKKKVVQELKDNLPPYLTYHNVAHTEYVLSQAIFIAKQQGVNQHDLLLIKIAALYHDIGFIKTNLNHEEESCSIARKELLQLGLEEKDIRKIEGMIMATNITQSPQNLLEEILVDADLEYLGTDKFIEIANGLFNELKHYNPQFSMQQFSQLQIKFLSSHQYFTNYCKAYRETKKQENLIALISVK